jgi:SnoaL-like domain
MSDSSLDTARAYVQAINARNMAAIRALLTPNHTFTDALGARLIGDRTMLMGWQHFFDLFPEYWIRVDTALADGAHVALFGEAGGRWKVEDRVLPRTWKVRAAWLAEVEGGKVKAWSVYCDTGWARPPAEESAPPE